MNRFPSGRYVGEELRATTEAPALITAVGDTAPNTSDSDAPNNDRYYIEDYTQNFGPRVVAVYDARGDKAEAGQAVDEAHAAIMKGSRNAPLNASNEERWDRMHAAVQMGHTVLLGLHQEASVAIAHLYATAEGKVSVTIGHAGNVRAYLFRPAAKVVLRHLTLDDAVWSKNVPPGLVIQPGERNEAYEDAMIWQRRISALTKAEQLVGRSTLKNYFQERWAVTQGIGVRKSAIHIRHLELQHGDRLGMLTNGVHYNLNDAEIADIFVTTINPLASVQALLERAGVWSTRTDALRSWQDERTAVVAVAQYEGRGVLKEPKTLRAARSTKTVEHPDTH